MAIAMYDESMHLARPYTSNYGRNSHRSCSYLIICTEKWQKLDSENTFTKSSEGINWTSNNFCSFVVLQFFLSTNMAECLRKNEEITFSLDSDMLTKYKQLFFVMIRELMRSKLIIPTGQNNSMHCLDSFSLHVCISCLLILQKLQIMQLRSIHPWAAAKHADALNINERRLLPGC